VTGQDSGFVQLKDDGPVLVHVAQSEPATSVVSGAVLYSGALEEVSLTGLEEGDVVYGRSLKTGETNRVSVIAPGAAPA
jgi:hypothetical protein